LIREQFDEHGVLELVLDAPPANALDLADIAALAQALRGCATNEAIRAVVVRGEGRGFCAGGDVKEVQALPEFAGILGQARGSLELTSAVAECAVPVIGAVHGYCIGLGVLVAGMCDILLAAPGTPFVLAEADNGAAAGTVQAIGLMPEKRLRAALFTAEPVAAEELHAFGSVLRLVPAADLPDAARTIARTIAGKRPKVIRALKAATDASLDRRLRLTYRAELSHTLELNLAGEADQLRADFVAGRRAGYLASEGPA
jgi:enoyl-CoA hydratase